MASEDAFEEVEVSWRTGDIEIFATLARPAGAGPFPAVIFVAGSGPTDRDWNSPLIPGTNGSGARLARALAGRGFITLRYDKSASGPHAAENYQRLAGKISLQAHIDEVAGGVDLLANREDVDLGNLFALTNSEGCVHAINYQLQGEGPRFAGMVLTSSFARAAGVLARHQIAAQMAQVPGGDAIMAAYDEAMADFTAGRPVQPDERLPEVLQQVVLGITQPGNLPFSRELWAYEPAEKLEGIDVPILIVLGKKDIQVDWRVDGEIFEQIAQKHAGISIVYLENANHVLKYEPIPREQITPQHAMETYSADGIELDPQAVETISSWLNAHLKQAGR